MEYFIKILMSAIGTAAFSLLYRVKAKHIPHAAVGGALTCAIYLLADRFGVALFLSNLIAALASVLYSNVMARLLKTPAIIFITGCILPLVPGSALFYTMNCLILQDMNGFWMYAESALTCALGIAAGISVESTIITLFGKLSSLTKKKGGKTA